MESIRRCVYCGKILEKESSEHIIQNALGGILESKDICCPDCNNLISKCIDHPFTKYFSPFLNKITNMDKTNNTHSVPVYDVQVEYQGEKYDGKAKNGKLIACSELCQKLKCNLNEIKPEPKITGIKFPLDNQIFKNGFCKIAFNFALSRGVDIKFLQDGLNVDLQNNRISFNYLVIPFFPSNFFEASLELTTKMKMFHGLILFDCENELWCYIDLFNTFQFYVRLSNTWDNQGRTCYESYFQPVEKINREVETVKTMTFHGQKDVLAAAQQYNVETSIDTCKLKENIIKGIKQKQRKMSLTELLNSVLGQMDCTSLFDKENANIELINEYIQYMRLYFDDNDQLIEGRFRKITFKDAIYNQIISYPEFIMRKLATGFYPSIYTYSKFNRLARYLKLI